MGSAVGNGPGLVHLAVGYWLATRNSDVAPPDFHRITYRRGYIREARFAPDGQSILYTAAWDGGTPKVYSTRFDSTESSELPLDNTALLSVSTRGALALLSKIRTGTFNDSGTLATASSAANAPRELDTMVTFADWNPDGSELALIRNSTEAHEWVLEYPRGNIIFRKKTKDGPLRSVRLAPEGDLLAIIDYAGDDDGRVVLLDRKGNKKAQSPLYGAVLGCAWSADGREIWYTANMGSNKVIYGMDLRGKVRLVLRVPGALALKDVSRRGRVLLCKEEITTNTMFQGRGEKTERNLSWYSNTILDDLSDDGKTMTFIEGGEATEERWGEYLRRTDGSPAVRLGDYLFGKLSPDGNLVLAITQFDEKVPSTLAVLPTGPGTIRPFPVGKWSILYSPRWNWLPDSKSFVFSAAEEGRRPRTLIQQMNGNPPVPITPEGVVGRHVTPDGKFLVTRDSPTTGVLYPLGEGAQVRIQGFLPGETMIRWHADGRRLFVAESSNNGWNVSLLEPYSGRREPWRQIHPSVDRTGLASMGHLILSADGECFAYYVGHQLSQLYVVEGLH